MKKIIYIAFAAAALAAVSCSKNAEFNETPVDGEQVLTLHFSTGSLQTRTVAGVNNENLVKRIDYFFFPYGADGKVDPSAEYVYKGFVVPGEGHELELEYRETISPGILNKIFPNGNKTAVVMAIANYVGKYGPTATEPETTIPEDAKTWQALHELEVGPTFFKDGGPGFQLRWPRRMNPDEKDLFFVMAADSVEVDLHTSGQYAIDEEVPLKRLASKVTVSFTFEECIDDKGIKWVPQYQEGQAGADEARVFLSNGIEHTTIGGPLTRDLVADGWGTATQPLGNGNRDIFEYAYDFLLDIQPDANGKLAAHYYTYPISMEEGNDNQPYLKLVLPWYGYVNRAAEGQEPVWVMAKQKEVYYKIVLPRETISEPNMIYAYDVLVNILGNEKEVQITGEEYRVKDWSSDEPIDNNVGLGRYISLDIPKDTYDMYGSRVEILYVSSGEVEISKLQIYDQVLTGTTPVDHYYINGGPTSYQGDYNANTPDYRKPNPNPLSKWVSLSTEGTMLVIDHTMNTTLGRDVNISPFKFVVTLHLKGVEGTTFDRTVTITQYPPIYATISNTASTGTVFINGDPYTDSSEWVDNNNGEHMAAIGGSSSGKTSKTIISVSTLASLDTEPYLSTTVANPVIGVPVIGDPRVSIKEVTPKNPINGDTWGADDLGSEDNNYLEDYLYTAVDKQNVIAPKFMLSSGLGGTNNIGGAQTKVDWLHNLERCASYQEDGYPAGRWRLPTEAEIYFTYQLGMTYGVINNPWTSTSRYWANTARRIEGGSFSTAQVSNISSRCIYDLWYWGDQQYDSTGNPIAEGSTTAPATRWLGFMTSK